MSEEKSEFKVTDRRLFNADGTPREVAREDAPAPTNDAPAATASEAVASTPQSATASAPAEEPRAGEAAGVAADNAPAAGGEEELVDAAYDEEAEIPGANDPASFVNFLMSIASNAAASLGMMEHPVTGQRGVDLPLGKHWIDVLGMLEEKTRGNLSPQEQQIFTGLLADLRMQYVSLTSTATPKRPGFTASDILGGK